MHTCVKEVGLRRRLTKVRFRTILAAAILTACGGEEVTEKSSSSSTAPTSIAADSGESSRQADHFVFRGAECNVTCAEPAVDQLGAEVELDEADPRFEGVAEVAGEDVSDVVALRARGRVERCPIAAWVLAFGRQNVVDKPTTVELARLRCDLPAKPDDPRCAEGGPF